MSKSYKPPIEVAKRAKLARNWKEKYPDKVGDAGTRVGWYRSSQLANRRPLSIKTIKRMYSFFKRHKKNKSYSGKPYSDAGKVIWEAWGGDAGFKWVKNILDKS
ncbi:MAG: hypothetical protein ACOC56_01905 [Atribacterota bacterium]